MFASSTLIFSASRGSGGSFTPPPVEPSGFSYVWPTVTTESEIGVTSGYRWKVRTPIGSGAYTTVRTVTPGVAIGTELDATTVHAYNTQFDAIIVAYNGSGESSITYNPFQFWTAPSDTAPVLTATVSSSYQIDLTWTYTPNPSNGGFIVARDGVEITRVAANIRAYSDTGLTGLTTYAYTVRPYNSNPTIGGVNRPDSLGVVSNTDSEATLALQIPLSFFPSAWFEANDANTLFDATTAGSLVVADSSVARWEDKSGNLRHMIQSDGAPIRKTSIISGRGVMRFDGDNDRMESATHGITTAATFFVVVANKRSSISGTTIDTVLSLNTISNDGSNAGIALITSNGYGSTTQRDTMIFSTVGDETVRKNGNTTPTAIGVNEFFIFSAVYSGIDTQIARTLTLGRLLKTGDFNNYSGQIDIAEVLIFPSALATPDRQAVEAWLNSKYLIY